MLLIDVLAIGLVVISHRVMLPPEICPGGHYVASDPSVPAVIDQARAERQSKRLKIAADMHWIDSSAYLTDRRTFHH